MKSLASSFFMLGRINTTEAKAKELRPFVEKFVTRSKQPTLASRRHLRKFFSEAVVRKVIERANVHAKRPGGYTRIVKLGARKSDGARLALIEFVE